MEFNEFDVRVEIKKMGYGIGTHTNKAFMITKKSGPVRKYDGLQRDLPVGSITVVQLNKVLSTSNNVKEAAQRCISICSGQGDFQVANTLDEKVQAGVQAALQQLGLTPELLVKLKTESDVKQAVAPVAEPEKRKRGRPKKATPIVTKIGFTQ